MFVRCITQISRQTCQILSVWISVGEDVKKKFHILKKYTYEGNVFIFLLSFGFHVYCIYKHTNWFTLFLLCSRQTFISTTTNERIKRFNYFYFLPVCVLFWSFFLLLVGSVSYLKKYVYDEQLFFLGSINVIYCIFYVINKNWRRCLLHDLYVLVYGTVVTEVIGKSVRKLLRFIQYVSPSCQATNKQSRL